MDVQNALASLGGYNALLATLEQSLIGINLCMKTPVTPEEQSERERSISLFDTLYSALQEVRDLPPLMNREAFKNLLGQAAIAKDIRMLLGIQVIAPTVPLKNELWEKLRPTHAIFDECQRQVAVETDRLQQARNTLRELIRSIDQKTSELKTHCEVALRSGQLGTVPRRPF